MNYVIMNKEVQIGTFEFIGVFEGKAKILKEIYIEPNFINRYGKVSSWIKKRKLPKNREFMSNLLYEWGLSDDETWIKVSHGISLNDTLWIKAEDENITWGQVNPYQNEFNDIVAKYAFTGSGLKGIQFNTTSPEFGTNGMLPKCWKRYEDTIYLLKGGTVGARNSGNEPHCEYFASQVLSKMKDIEFVKYDICKYHERLVSKCKLFTNEDTGYISVANTITSFSDPYEYYFSLSKEDKSKLSNLIVFDSLICNTDRHLNNFGYLIDNESFELKGLAPVFDNGLGLLPYWLPEFDKIEDYVRKKSHCLFDGDFISIGKQFLNDENRAMLRNLIGFRFENSNEYPYPEEKLQALNNLVNNSVNELLKGEKKNSISLTKEFN